MVNVTARHQKVLALTDMLGSLLLRGTVIEKKKLEQGYQVSIAQRELQKCTQAVIDRVMLQSPDTSSSEATEVANEQIAKAHSTHDKKLLPPEFVRVLDAEQILAKQLRLQKKREEKEGQEGQVFAIEEEEEDEYWEWVFKSHTFLFHTLFHMFCRAEEQELKWEPTTWLVQGITWEELLQQVLNIYVKTIIV